MPNQPVALILIAKCSNKNAIKTHNQCKALKYPINVSPELILEKTGSKPYAFVLKQKNSHRLNLYLKKGLQKNGCI